ncbi:citrate/2-methylcitrate synthase [Georgenia sunbinii]|uniref:citrate/2-methylcitrate synthase n=1 Tax=Georgenia sunbinii TaxID=3117728 RepID=UPI002F26B225
MSPESSQSGPAPVFAVGADGAPSYRGVPLASVIGQRFESVWGLLVDGVVSPALPPAEPFPLPVRTGDTRVDVQSALAQIAPVWGFRSLLDTPPDRARQDLARASVLALSFVAQSARGVDVPAVPQQEIEAGRTVAERFLIRWSGETQADKAAALDALWAVVAEDGLSPSTQIARTVAATGSDLGACLSGAVAAVGGPLAAGAAARVAQLATAVHDGADAVAAVRETLREQTIVPGFVEGTADPRADLLREVCAGLDVPLYAAARAVERAGRELLEERLGQPARTNVPFWAAILLHHVGFEARMFNALIICGRTAGWSAHVLEAHHDLVAGTTPHP